MIGDEHADTLMESLRMDSADQLATNSDVVGVKKEVRVLREDIQIVRGDVQELKSEVREFKTEFRSEMREAPLRDRPDTRRNE